MKNKSKARKQTLAISLVLFLVTVRLLDLSHGWHPEIQLFMIPRLIVSLFATKIVFWVAALKPE